MVPRSDTKLGRQTAERIDCGGAIAAIRAITGYFACSSCACEKATASSVRKGNAIENGDNKRHSVSEKNPKVDMDALTAIRTVIP
jgi:hypothetical protein